MSSAARQSRSIGTPSWRAVTPGCFLTREERAQLLARGVDPTAQAFDLSAWERVRALVDVLKRDGTEVRRFLGSQAGKVPEGEVLDFHSPGARLHAKTYLFTGDDTGFASVGSSNLTKSGLRENVELNLVSSDRELVDQLNEWFDGKWEQGQDCTEEFIERLEDCVLFGRRYTPWQVFLKSLHAAYGQFLDIGISEALAERLAGFQQHAVQRCVTLIERHWGVMLCDSVGLGKTYEGLGILQEFASPARGKHAGVGCLPGAARGQLESRPAGGLRDFGRDGVDGIAAAARRSG